MSEERRSPHNTESDESGLLLSVDPISERSVDFTPLSDDSDNVDAADTAPRTTSETPMAPMLLILTQRMTLTVQTNCMRGVELWTRKLL